MMYRLAYVNFAKLLTPINEYGETPYAFIFKRRFSPEDLINIRKD